MFRKLLFFSALLSLALVAYMYFQTIRDPIVRSAEIEVAQWPEDSPPLKILLISDVHVAGPDMPPERLSRIVDQINALAPDMVLFAGDFVSDKTVATHIYSASESLEPLSNLKPKISSIAVLGNHDHWRNQSKIIDALKANGIVVLNNEVQNYNSLIIGGVDDDFTGNSNLPKVLEELAPFDGYKIIVSHSPDIFPEVTDDVPLVLAGHTHCGQIVLPVVGAMFTASRYGKRYACGLVKENGKTMIVGAGLGTSILPLRLGAVPDMWSITLRPPKN